MRIWKWPLQVADQQTIRMPHGAQILDVQMQGEGLQLWALVEEGQSQVEREIAIYGTGNPMPKVPGKYIATFQMHGGALVFHVFDTTV
ncbi:DUF7352 domain-containing protein [Cupriavidus necator]